MRSGSCLSLLFCLTYYNLANRSGPPQSFLPQGICTSILLPGGLFSWLLLTFNVLEAFPAHLSKVAPGPTLITLSHPPAHFPPPGPSATGGGASLVYLLICRLAWDLTFAHHRPPVPSTQRMLGKRSPEEQLTEGSSGRPPFPRPCPHLLQPPDLLLLLLQAEPSLLVLHLELLPPLGHLPHVLQHKTLGQGQSPAPPFLWN